MADSKTDTKKDTTKQPKSEATNTVETFVCAKYPRLDMGEEINGQWLKFENGILKTDSKEASDFIREHRMYRQGLIVQK